MNRTATKNISALDGEKHAIYSRLMAVSTGMQNDDVLACMLTSVCMGEGAMPFRLGLSEADYEKMMQLYFPGAQLPISYLKPQLKPDSRLEEQKDNRLYGSQSPLAGYGVVVASRPEQFT